MKLFTISLWYTILISIAIALFLSRIDVDLTLYLLPNHPSNGFEDKVVWITGASSGIGASLAKDLTMAGAQVIISARREDKLNQVIEMCQGKGKHIPVSVPLDVLNFEKQKEAYDKIIKKFGKIDSIVLNAGRTQRSLALDTDISQTKEILDLNFFSTVNLARIVLKDMALKKSGHVIVISSVAGKFGVPISSSYSASKFALQGYFDSLRAEVSSQGIHVTTVCPGPVESEIADHAHRDPTLPKQIEGTKMSTERCTQLITKAMYYKFDEVWISEQPFLFVSYLMVYTPWIGRQLLSKVLGPARVKSLKTGASLYDIKTNLGFDN